MPTLQEYKDAYRKAYNAGNEEAARRLLKVIQENSTSEQESFSVSEFLKENMEIPGGLAGAATGAGIGFLAAGPPGAIVGSVIGGATGSGAGSVASDLYEGVEPDYAKAMEEALISAGIDVFTLGIGSKIKPFLLSAKAARMQPSEAAELFVKEAAMVAGEQSQEAISKAIASEAVARTGSEGLAAGSQESLLASQEIAQKAGGTFTPSQTGRASSLQILTEGIANLGILSSQAMQKNAEKIENAAQSTLASVINRSATDFDDPSTLGNALFEVIDTAKKAAGSVYDQSIQEIRQGLGSKVTETGPLKASLTKFVNKNQRKFGNMLDEKTLNYVQKLQQTLKIGTKLPVTDLIDMQTVLNKEIRKLGSFDSPAADKVISAEFAELSKNLRGVIQRAVERTDPVLAQKYADTKKSFALSTEGLLPKINDSFIRNAKKGQYTPLGRLITNVGSVDQIVALNKSIDEAYRLIPNKELKDLSIKTAKDAKDAMKSAFLSAKFSTAQGKFDPTSYVTLAEEFQKPEKAARMAAILGKDTATVKQVMNLIAESSQELEGNLGSLLFRTKEYRAVEAPIRVASQLAQGGGLIALVGYGALDLMSSGLILTLPLVFAKISTNPKLANKLIAFENTKFPTEEAKIIAANTLAEEAISEMTEEDRKFIRDEIRASNQVKSITRGQRKAQEQRQQLLQMAN